MNKIMKTMKTIGLIFIFVSMAACKSGEPEKEIESADGQEYVIGVVTKSLNSEYTYSLKSGLDAAVREDDVDMIFIHPDYETEIDVQNIMIDSMVNSNIDALIVSPCDSSYTDYVEVAKSKNIPVFAMDTELYHDDVPYIGADNYKIGEMAAEQMIQELGGEGEIAILAGTLAAAPHLQRIEGFKHYIQANSDIEVVYEEEAFCDFRHAVAKTQEILLLFPNVDGIFAGNATMALGVLDRLEFSDHTIDIPIIGVDTQSDTIRKVMDGEITAMISQNGYDIGYEAMKTVFRFLEGEKVSSKTIIESKVITKENAEEFLKVIK